MIIIGSKNRKAQTFIEYSLLIAVCVGVLLTMHNYLSRSLQGRLKGEIDKINPAGDYTLINGRGNLAKTTTGVMWEHKKGHAVTWRSSFQNEKFSYNLDSQLPPNFFENYFQNCQGAECDLAAVSDSLDRSLLGEQAYACMEGDSNCRSAPYTPGKQADPTKPAIDPVGSTGSGPSYDNIDVAEAGNMQDLYDNVETGSTIQRHYNPKLVDPDSVYPGSEGDSGKQAAREVVDDNIDHALEEDSPPEWAKPILRQE